MENLLTEIRKCEICMQHLPHEVNPVLSASASSKIVIVGQAPGRAVHETGIPWNDKSGQRLREWLGVDDHEFYNDEKFALVPIGFCYPGKGKSGDLPPRKECAPEWQDKLFQKMPDVKLTLLIGNYAQNHYLNTKRKKTLTETVQNFEEYLPKYFVLPHPSPRNNIWLKKMNGLNKMLFQNSKNKWN